MPIVWAHDIVLSVVGVCHFGLLGPLTALALCGAPESSWTVARNNHFVIYSQAGEEAARTTLGWFEQLRAFFLTQMKIETDNRPPLRVIGFRSVEQYRTYSLRPEADAYFLGADGRDYIVMSGLGGAQFGVAAHEYAHFGMHAGGMRLPSWAGEGLAEFYSTVRISPQGCSIGGELPGNMPHLRRPWMALEDLFSTTSGDALETDRSRAAMFYAQSWILMHMLVLSPEYGRRFPEFIAALTNGTPTTRAFASVYGKTLDRVERDARAWAGRSRFAPIPLPGVTGEAASSVGVFAVSTTASRLLLAEISLAGGGLDRAEALYRELVDQSPDVADGYAGLGAVALRRGYQDGARAAWKKAIERRIEDPMVCYRYAVLAQDAGVNRLDIRAALERAVALDPDFDDARFALALLELNTGQNDAAVTQFRAMKRIGAARAFSYWSGLAYSLNELDRREEAKAAALEARKHAATPSEQARASQLAYMASTDFAVRLSRDANGADKMVAARIPHDETAWNPFIQPEDRIRRVEGVLREIQCEGKALRITVVLPDGPLLLSIEDRARVQMRNAPPEFTCGRQAPRKVAVEYAMPDAIRGIDFR